MDDNDPFLNLPIFKKYRALDDKGNTTRSTVSDKPKSYAQVETLVRPPVVRPKSGGLKPGRIRSCRLMARYSKEERKQVIDRAEAMGMSVNEYIRTATLGQNYASPLNPELRQRFIALQKELCRHGIQLGRIADLMGTNPLSPQEADSLLGTIVQSLFSMQSDVRSIVKIGKTYI
jgi:hypothetical protein